MYSNAMAKASAKTSAQPTKSLKDISSLCKSTAGGYTDSDEFVTDAGRLLNELTFMYANEFKTAEATRMLQEFSGIVKIFAAPRLRRTLTAIIYRIRAFAFVRKKQWSDAIRKILKLLPSSAEVGPESLAKLDADILLLLAEIYDATRRYDNALMCAKLAASKAQSQISLFDLNVHEKKLQIIGPTLEPQCALALSYHTLACQLERTGLGHLSTDWNQRALDALCNTTHSIVEEELRDQIQLALEVVVSFPSQSNSPSLCEHPKKHLGMALTSLRNPGGSTMPVEATTLGKVTTIAMEPNVLDQSPTKKGTEAAGFRCKSPSVFFNEQNNQAGNKHVPINKAKVESGKSCYVLTNIPGQPSPLINGKTYNTTSLSDSAKNYDKFPSRKDEIKFDLQQTDSYPSSSAYIHNDDQMVSLPAVYTSTSNSTSPKSARAGTPTVASARLNKPEHLRIVTEISTQADSNLNTMTARTDTPSSQGPQASARHRYTSWTSARLLSVVADEKLTNSFIFTGPYVGLTSHTPVNMPAPTVPPKLSIEQEYQRQQQLKKQRQLAAAQSQPQVQLAATVHDGPSADLPTSYVHERASPISKSERDKLRSPLKSKLEREHNVYLATQKAINRINDHRNQNFYAGSMPSDLLMNQVASVERLATKDEQDFRRAFRGQKQKARQLLRATYGGLDANINFNNKHGLGPNLNKMEDSHLTQYLDRVAIDVLQHSTGQTSGMDHVPRYVPLYQLSNTQRHHSHNNNASNSSVDIIASHRDEAAWLSQFAKDEPGFYSEHQLADRELQHDAEISDFIAVSPKHGSNAAIEDQHEVSQSQFRTSDNFSSHDNILANDSKRLTKVGWQSSNEEDLMIATNRPTTVLLYSVNNTRTRQHSTRPMSAGANGSKFKPGNRNLMRTTSSNAFCNVGIDLEAGKVKRIRNEIEFAKASEALCDNTLLSSSNTALRYHIAVVNEIAHQDGVFQAFVPLTKQLEWFGVAELKQPKLYKRGQVASYISPRAASATSSDHQRRANCNQMHQQMILVQKMCLLSIKEYQDKCLAKVQARFRGCIVRSRHKHVLLHLRTSRQLRLRESQLLLREQDLHRRMKMFERIEGCQQHSTADVQVIMDAEAGFNDQYLFVEHPAVDQHQQDVRENRPLVSLDVLYNQAGSDLDDLEMSEPAGVGLAGPVDKWDDESIMNKPDDWFEDYCASLHGNGIAEVPLIISDECLRNDIAGQEISLLNAIPQANNSIFGDPGVNFHLDTVVEPSSLNHVHTTTQDWDELLQSLDEVSDPTPVHASLQASTHSSFSQEIADIFKFDSSFAQVDVNCGVHLNDEPDIAVPASNLGSLTHDTMLSIAINSEGGKFPVDIADLNIATSKHSADGLIQKEVLGADVESCFHINAKFENDESAGMIPLESRSYYCDAPASIVPPDEFRQGAEETEQETVQTQEYVPHSPSSEQEVMSSEQLAQESEQQATQMEQEAMQSKQQQESEQEVMSSEQLAQESEQQATQMEQEAMQSEQQEQESEQEAVSSEQLAQESEQQATQMEQEAMQSEQQATQTELHIFSNQRMPVLASKTSERYVRDPILVNTEPILLGVLVVDGGATPSQPTSGHRSRPSSASRLSRSESGSSFNTRQARLTDLISTQSFDGAHHELMEVSMPLSPPSGTTTASAAATTSFDASELIRVLDKRDWDNYDPLDEVPTSAGVQSERGRNNIEVGARFAARYRGR